MVSFLQIVDNPRQDVPLLAVLRSPLLGFSPDRLAQIRGGHPGETTTALCVPTTARIAVPFWSGWRSCGRRPGS